MLEKHNIYVHIYVFAFCFQALKRSDYHEKGAYQVAVTSSVGPKSNLSKRQSTQPAQVYGARHSGVAAQRSTTAKLAVAGAPTQVHEQRTKVV